MTRIGVPGMDCYEDMLKEINKKIYEDTVMEAEEMRVMQEYDGETFKLEESHNSLSAFGLAALVQNGFPTTTLFSLSAQQELEKLQAEEDTWISSDESIPWTDSKIASYNSAQKLFRCNECECVGFLSRVAEHWLGTHANLRVFQCPQCPYASAWARCVRMHLARQHNVCPDPNQESLTLWKENPVLEEVTKYLERLKNLVEGECIEEPKDDDADEECHQNAMSTQTSTPPPSSPEDQHSMSPQCHSEHDDLQHQDLEDQELRDLHQQQLHEQELHQQQLHEQELHQQQLHEQELHQQQLHEQELHDQELQQQELHQQEIQDQELHQQELHDQELRQQEIEQELQQQEMHQQELQEMNQQELQQHELQQHELQQHELQQHELQQHELQQHELQAQEGQITHVIEEHIQVPEEVANQLQQIAAAQHGEGHPQLQIVITQQENQDLPPTIQIQIAPTQDLSPHIVSSTQQAIPLQQALSQSLASTLTQQVISQAAQVITHQPITQQIVVQQPQVIQTTISGKVTSPQPAVQLSTKSRHSHASDNSSSPSRKRYNCRYCHYATDRRDLYTRHENIHRDEKPFHCYICQKQFNRADHVKKHFLRMHRDTPYDINMIKRTISKDSSSSTSTIQYFSKAQPRLQPPPPTPSTTPPVIQQPTVETVAIQSINIPGFAAQKLSEDKKVTTKKKPGEKRYTCCYCSWSGVDNWCLKRHLNTHLKPYVCNLCEYKAARSERLATHVHKVHNKRACSRCSFLADDQVQLTLHMQQNHQIFPFKDRKEQNNNLHYLGITCSGYKTEDPSFQSPKFPKPLICILCGKQTTTEDKMIQHLEHHSSSQQSVNYGTALESFPLQTIITEGTEEFSPTKHKRIKYFLRKRGRFVMWKKYRRLFRNRKILRCCICYSTKSKFTLYYGKASLSRHFLFFHTKMSYKCNMCCIYFRYKYQMFLHKKSIH